jgi:hypothetical protein
VHASVVEVHLSRPISSEVYFIQSYVVYRSFENPTPKRSTDVCYTYYSPILAFYKFIING